MNSESKEEKLICPECNSKNINCLAIMSFDDDLYECRGCHYRWGILAVEAEDQECSDLITLLIERALRDKRDIVFLTLEQSLNIAKQAGVGMNMSHRRIQISDGRVFKWKLTNLGQSVVFEEVE